MNQIQASLVGVVLASGLVLTAQAAAPEDVVARILQAQDEQSLAATWRDWHPKAEHKVIIKYGLGQKDDVFSYRLADDVPAEDPQFARALEGYQELSRSAPTISSVHNDGVTRVTAATRVHYEWQGYSGEMLQTDDFAFTAYLGVSVIRSLVTTYDYR
ncbi:MAG: hypothetical protein AB3N15_08040 [Paracoccaceae bacterium]